MQENFNTPILIIIFNRLEFSKQILDRVRTIKASNLYVACDGWRNHVPGEREKVLASREYFKNAIEWECDVKYLYLDENKGSGEAVFNAISWFFQNEKYGIILEEDCIPSIPFFPYCEELLQRYENDLRVWMISGLNHFVGKRNLIDEDSYFFSKYAAIWGWATWANRWNTSNFDMRALNIFIENKYIFDDVPNQENSYSIKKYRDFYKKMEIQKPKTWDAQWGFTMWSNRGVRIVPSENLISNVGVIGVHSKKQEASHLLPVSDTYRVIKHPDFILVNYLYDREYFNKYRKKISILNRLVKKMIKIFTK